MIPKGRGWMLRSESSGEDIYGRIVARVTVRVRVGSESRGEDIYGRIVARVRVRVRVGSESRGEDIYGRTANQPSPSPSL